MDYYTIMITSKYFNSIEDFIHLEMATKRFRGNMEKFHYNPIALTSKTFSFFPNIETYHVYDIDDEISNSNKIEKYVIWYKLNYHQSLVEKMKGNECKNVCYTEDDKKKYGCIIPDSVNEIGNYCFEFDCQMTEITIPSNIKHLSDHCFSYCLSLQHISIPNSISSLGFCSFFALDSLVSLTVGDQWKLYGDRLIKEDCHLCGFQIPHNVTLINNQPIVLSQVTSFEIPEGTESLSNFLFLYCSSIQSIHIPSSLTKIGTGCFAQCTGLTSITFDPESKLKIIGSKCFSLCNSIETIFIPSSVTSIGEETFTFCKQLKTVVFEKGSQLKKINKHCFNNCPLLQTIILPSTLKSFHENSIRNCSTLSTLAFWQQKKEAPIKLIENDINIIEKHCIVKKEKELKMFDR